MARRPQVPQPITSVRIETPEPVLPPESDGRIRRPWPWQQEAIAALKDSARRMLTAPTGSGKATVVEALGLHDLARGMKVIVAVPQLAIASAYERESIELDGVPRQWNPGTRVDEARIRHIVRFLLEPPARSETGRTLVCTQIALAMAADQLRVNAATDAWNEVSLFLDEAHHSLTLASQGRRQALQNSLGRIVNHYLRGDSGTLSLITATWLRTDGGAIVPDRAVETFARYHRGFHEHMRDLRHLRTLEIRFIIGGATECLEALFRERHPSTLKTVVWHPAPGSGALRRQGGKHAALGAYRHATGWCRNRRGSWDTHEFDGKRFTALELINGGPQRRDSVRRLLAGIETQRHAAQRDGNIDGARHRTPDVVWALNLLREGSDYPALARGILMAPRGAMLDTLQMFGRLLRDCPGKERVEFDIVLPTDGPNLMPKAQQVASYLQYMMASLLIEWQFRGFASLDESSSEDERHALSFLERTDGQEHLAADLVDAAIRFGDAGLALDEEREHIVDHVITNGRTGSSIAPEARGVVQQRLRRMLIGRQVGAASILNVEESLVGRLRSFVGKFGYEDLRQLREELAQVPSFTLPQLYEAMHAFHRRHGRWPGRPDAAVSPEIGRSWASIDMVLQRGGRGLEGGSSLAKERARLLKLPLRRLTREALVSAIRAFHEEHGTWPSESTEGSVPGLRYTWRYVRDLLRSHGKLRSPLPRGVTVAKLVRECQGRIPFVTRIKLDIVREAIREHRRSTGLWPSNDSPGDVPGVGGTWSSLDTALRRGRRGIGKASKTSLARLVSEMTGIPTSSRVKAPLTLVDVENAMLRWRKETGKWPRAGTDGMARDLGATWSSLDNALHRGGRNLPRGWSLRKLRERLERQGRSQ